MPGPSGLMNSVVDRWASLKFSSWFIIRGVRNDASVSFPQCRVNSSIVMEHLFSVLLELMHRSPERS